MKVFGWPEDMVLNQANPLTGLVQMSLNVCELNRYFLSLEVPRERRAAVLCQFFTNRFLDSDALGEIPQK
jgi:hypothetical protein